MIYILVGLAQVFIMLLRMVYNLTHEFFISGILHLIFSDHGCLQITETAESETMDKGGLLYITEQNRQKAQLMRNFYYEKDRQKINEKISELYLIR